MRMHPSEGDKLIACSPYTLPEAAERAYGALWRCMEPNPPPELFQARKMLLAAIGKDGQRRGIAWALETFGEVQDSEMHSLIRSGNLP